MTKTRKKKRKYTKTSAKWKKKGVFKNSLDANLYVVSATNGNLSGLQKENNELKLMLGEKVLNHMLKQALNK